MTSANYCRLCIQKSAGVSTLLHKNLKLCDMLNNLFPGMNLNLVEAAAICDECFKYIQFSYTMRDTVIKNEGKVLSHMDSIGTKDKNICRLCLTTELSEATLLYENKYQTMSYMEARSIIEIAIVEMRFELFKKPVVCQSCWQIVRTIYLFKKRCFAIEKVLKFYSTQNSLSLLNPKEMESVSKCYNSHLQKLFEDSSYNLRPSLPPREPIKNDWQIDLGFVDNFIRPIDVYLNNFTTENNPDGIFKEEADDVFVETPRIVKEEVFDISEPFLESIMKDTQNAKKTVVEDNKSILKDCTDCVSDITKNIAENKFDEQLEHVLQIKIIPETNKNTNLAKKQVKKSCGKRAGVSLPKHKTKLKNFNETEVPSKEILTNNDGKNGKEFLKHTEQNKQINDKEQNIDVKKHCKTVEQCEKTKKNISKDVTNAVLANETTLKNKEVDKKAGKKQNTYVCEECGLKTKYKHHLRRHKLIHNKSGQLLTCSKCIYSTFIKRNFKRHALSHTAMENGIQCTHCVYRTVFPNHMKKHMLTHESKKDKTLKSNSDTQKRVKNNKATMSLRCKECPYETSKENQLVAHLRYHKSTEKILKCTKCHYITIRSHSFKYHMEIHNEESVPSKKTFKCKECAFIGKRYTHLVSHMIIHQNNYTFNCSECSYKAKRKSHLVTHMLRHKKGNKKKASSSKNVLDSIGQIVYGKYCCGISTAKVMFECSYCKYKTIRKDHLKHHYSNQHFDKEPQLYSKKVKVAVGDNKNGSDSEKKTKQCPYCSYKNKEAHLENHILTIHFPSASEIMQCNDCNYKSNDRKRLLNHFKVHDTRQEQKIMQCYDCSYKSNKRKGLLKHLKVHQTRKGQKKT